MCNMGDNTTTYMTLKGIHGVDGCISCILELFPSCNHLALRAAPVQWRRASHVIDLRNNHTIKLPSRNMSVVCAVDPQRGLYLIGGKEKYALSLWLINVKTSQFKRLIYDNESFPPGSYSIHAGKNYIILYNVYGVLSSTAYVCIPSLRFFDL